ncbi:hypothetical protein CYMTET_15732, partial [Cymbomonas tetramitiformis]
MVSQDGTIVAAVARVACCLGIPVFVFILLAISKDPNEKDLSGEVLLEETPTMAEGLKVQRFMTESKEFTLGIDYHKAVLEIERTFPQEASALRTGPSFIGRHVAELQRKQCALALWSQVEAGKLSRPSATVSEPQCNEVFPRVKNVELVYQQNWDDTMGEELTYNMMKVMGNTFLKAVRADEYQAPPVPVTPSAPEAPDVPPVPYPPPYPPPPLLSPPPPNCKRSQLSALENTVRLQYCSFNSAPAQHARSHLVVQATLSEALATSFLKVHALHPIISSMNKMPGVTRELQAGLQVVGGNKCRMPLVGTSQSRFPVFLGETSKALQLDCDIHVYESNFELMSALQACPRWQPLPPTTTFNEVKQHGTQLNIRIAQVEIGNGYGTSKMFRQAKRGLFPQKGKQMKVNLTTLDAVLCEPVAVVQAGLAASNPVPFCQVGDVPLIQISAHTNPSVVLD